MTDWTSLLPAIVAAIVAVLTIYKGIRHVQCGKCCSVDLEPAEKTVDTNIGLIQNLVNRFTPRRTPKQGHAALANPATDLEQGHMASANPATDLAQGV